MITGEGHDRFGARRRRRIGGRAVVVGAEAVGYAALDTLPSAGADVVAMVTDLARHQGDRLKAVNSRQGQGIPLLTRTTVTELRGRGRLSGVALRHRDGRTRDARLRHRRLHRGLRAGP